MAVYFLKSHTYQISGNKAAVTLCKNKDSGKIKWRQAFERNPSIWDECNFSSVDAALDFFIKNQGTEGYDYAALDNDDHTYPILGIKNKIAFECEVKIQKDLEHLHA